MSRPPQLWDGVVRRLGADMPAFSLDPWVRPLIAEELESDHLGPDERSDKMDGVAIIVA